MKPRLIKYLLYTSAIIVGGVLLFILIQTVRVKNTGFEVKTLWDWMQLLIIPFVLAGGAFYLNRSERNNEREIAIDRQQEAALQAYLDRMAELLLERKLRTTRNKEVRDVARTRTLSVLRGLDGKRKGMVLLFLMEAGLIAKKPIINLEGADLHGAILRKNVYLKGANLNGVNLSDAYLLHAHLEGASLERTLLRHANLTIAYFESADLEGADLEGAQLKLANLEGANLKYASLTGANLERANLTGANLTGANLTGANLERANLERANLTGEKMKSGNVVIYLSKAKLHNANLSSANLEGAEVLNEQLATVKSLKDATMPDGTKHE